MLVVGCQKMFSSSCPKENSSQNDGIPNEQHGVAPSTSTTMQFPSTITGIEYLGTAALFHEALQSSGTDFVKNQKLLYPSPLYDYVCKLLNMPIQQKNVENGFNSEVPETFCSGNSRKETFCAQPNTEPACTPYMSLKSFVDVLADQKAFQLNSVEVVECKSAEIPEESSTHGFSKSNVLNMQESSVTSNDFDLKSDDDSSFSIYDDDSVQVSEKEEINEEKSSAEEGKIVKLCL